MAVTYRARDLLLNRTVAVKLMREQFTTDRQFVERFRREAQAAARLSHENIASVYDTGSANGTYYIVMEYVEGTDLKQRIRRDGALPILTTLEIGRQIASALDAAHRSGLVHRDIKPHNILLNTEGKSKVTDFGIAKLTSDGEDTGVIIGSVHYISPEQARGEATTPSSDLYSLGAVLFEMLTGRTVFEADNAMAVAHKQIYERPPLLRTLRPDIPPTVESMVLRCLEKDPRARYQSAAELSAVLTQLINQLTQEETIVITPTAPSMDATMVFRAPVQEPEQKSTPPRPPYEDERPHSNGWLIFFIFILLACGVGFGAYQLLRPKPVPPAATVATDQPIAAPNLIGKSKSDAAAALTAAGLKANAKTEYSDNTPEGEVFRQDPDVLSKLQPGDTVTFWISKGKSTFLMPDVVGSSLNDAKTAIRNAGFAGNFQITSENSSDPKGQVTSSDPAAETIAKRSDKITLVISKGDNDGGPLVNETFRWTAPVTNSDSMYVRVEFERPVGSDPQVLWEGTLRQGDTIQPQRFQRKPDEQVRVRVYSGKDSDSQLQQDSEYTYGPGPNPTQIPGM